MKLLRLAPEKTNFPFMRFRRVSYPFSAFMSIVSVLLFIFVGMNFGIDFAGALRQTRELGRSLAQSAAEYVTEESRDVVGREELNAFHDDVDAIRDHVERLAVRIGRLAARMEHRA